MEALHIVVGGEAGQGLVTVGQLLAKVLVRCGYAIVVTQDYQSRIRGGHNTFRIRTSLTDLQAPQEAIDLLVALDPLTVDLHRGELTERGLILLDRRWPGPEGRCLSIPYQELAPERQWNMTALGIVAALLGLPEPQTTRAMTDFFGPKNPQAAEAGRQALEQAFSWTRDQHPSFPPLPPGTAGPPRLMLNGNEAIALGALSAGLKFFAFYPMSPSTTIGLTLASQASSLGLIVEQAEDEIAVINMALGASFAGAPSMVATSGGGFALMNEGVSLAGMTETPLVLAVCQRPGPATGLPTRTEQGDLELVLHAGHGEFPRAVFAPGSVEDCFSLTRKALETAERSQGPVFLLTDQFLADSYRAVKPFELTPPARRPAPGDDKGPETYLRYALTADGVSPRLFPGATKNLVIADSDEHTEDGHLTEDLIVRKQMVEKRLKKLDLLLEGVIPPEMTGPDRPDLLLVTWGSSRGAVLEAAEILRGRGRSVGVLHFSQVWPLRPDQFLTRLEEAGEVVSIESNAFGQFARLLRRETGFQIRRQIRRYDGWPITPEYILRDLETP
ncbi:MAG: 2-oxoacid:acceptor oxidoreductase subunit alpha [Deltaproteobacteria bacterium]|nr:2-oxoacid:acceptor oxidoreductase subunit alpha [Deltaproteobacteria bacterium]